jgi:hypothetical protein
MLWPLSGLCSPLLPFPDLTSVIAPFITYFLITPLIAILLSLFLYPSHLTSIQYIKPLYLQLYSS